MALTGNAITSLCSNAPLIPFLQDLERDRGGSAPQGSYALLLLLSSHSGLPCPVRASENASTAPTWSPHCSRPTSYLSSNTSSNATSSGSSLFPQRRSQSKLHVYLRNLEKARVYLCQKAVSSKRAGGHVCLAHRGCPGCPHEGKARAPSVPSLRGTFHDPPLLPQ